MSIEQLIDEFEIAVRDAAYSDSHPMGDPGNHYKHMERDEARKALLAACSAPEPGGKWADIPADVRAALEDYNSLLRTFSSVADRFGLSTNWDGLQPRIHAVLEKHHATWLKYAVTALPAGVGVPTPPRCTCRDFPGADEFCMAHKVPEDYGKPPTKEEKL